VNVGGSGSGAIISSAKYPKNTGFYTERLIAMKNSQSNSNSNSNSNSFQSSNSGIFYSLKNRKQTLIQIQ
jgi:hypothetical protein